MATFNYVLKLTDGTTNIILTSTPFSIREWQPKTGGDVEEIVTETCEMRVTDGSVSANLAEVRAINKLLIQAADAQKNRSISKVYLVWKESSSASEWRSEIKSGRAEWSAEATTLPFWRGDTQFVMLHWERVNYWEGAEAQLALTNPNGTDNTSGLTVYNCNDLAGSSPNIRANYVEISGEDVLGDIPGATRLEITNTSISTDTDDSASRIWVGQNFTDPDNFEHILEAEDANGETGSSSSLASDGYYVSKVISTTDETDLLTWTLGTALMEAAMGRYYRAMVMFRVEPSAADRFRMQIEGPGGVLWRGSLISIDSIYSDRIRDFGVFRLPPWLEGMTDLSGLDLVMRIKVMDQPRTLNVDYLQLTPLDGWRSYEPLESLDVGHRYIDDGINERLYMDDGSSNRKGNVIGNGRPIMVKPETDQRLYFLQHGGSLGTAAIDRSLSIKLYYRPRRRTL